MNILSCACVFHAWHRQAIDEHYWMMFYRSFKEPIFVRVIFFVPFITNIVS